MSMFTDRTDIRCDRDAVPTAEPTRDAVEREVDLTLKPEAGCLQKWLDLSA
jgi:hypothetical protein